MAPSPGHGVVTLADGSRWGGVFTCVCPSVCLSVCLSVYQHDISKTVTTKITNLNTEVFHHQFTVTLAKMPPKWLVRPIVVAFWFYSAPAQRSYSEHDIDTHLVTYLVWPHQPENPPGRPMAWRTSPRRSPSLFPSFCLTTL